MVVGKFHGHVTIEDNGSIADYCRGRSIKLTTIEDERADGSSRTVHMTTSYYLDLEPGALGRAIARLEALADGLQAAGFVVIRKKLEHEGLPTIEPFSESNYREFHIRLSIPQKSKQVVRQLAERAGLKCFMSRNPVVGSMDQFVSFRCYDGLLVESEVKLRGLLDALDKSRLKVIAVKRETAVYDTNPQMDDWFFPCHACRGCM